MIQISDNRLLRIGPEKRHLVTHTNTSVIVSSENHGYSVICKNNVLAGVIPLVRLSAVSGRRWNSWLWRHDWYLSKLFIITISSAVGEQAQNIYSTRKSFQPRHNRPVDYWGVNVNYLRRHESCSEDNVKSFVK